jgi:hypothetical protein
MALVVVALAFIFGVSFSDSAGQLAPPVTPPTSARSATIRFTSFSPVAVRGQRFRSGEHVKITVQAGRSVSRNSVATAHGSFSVSFDTIAVDPCSSANAIAVGSAGSRAQTKLVFRECPPA